MFDSIDWIPIILRATGLSIAYLIAYFDDNEKISDIKPDKAVTILSLLLVAAR